MKHCGAWWSRALKGNMVNNKKNTRENRNVIGSVIDQEKSHLKIK